MSKKLYLLVNDEDGSPQFLIHADSMDEAWKLAGKDVENEEITESEESGVDFVQEFFTIHDITDLRSIGSRR